MRNDDASDHLPLPGASMDGQSFSSRDVKSTTSDPRQHVQQIVVDGWSFIDTRLGVHQQRYYPYSFVHSTESSGQFKRMLQYSSCEAGRRQLERSSLEGFFPYSSSQFDHSNNGMWQAQLGLVLRLSSK